MKTDKEYLEGLIEGMIDDTEKKLFDIQKDKKATEFIEGILFGLNHCLKASRILLK